MIVVIHEHIHTTTPGEYEGDDTDVHATLREVMTATQPERLIESNGPLTVAELPAQLRGSEAFGDFVAHYDWPSRLNTEGLEPPTQYPDDEAFWNALWHRDAPDYLNNFVHWYLTEPKHDYSLQDTYALKPALHRAYVVAPEFMHALHEAMREVFEVDKPIGHVDDVVIDNPDTAHAAHLAYKLLGRLVTANDTALLSDMHLRDVRLSRDVGPITNLHNYFFM